MQDMIAKNSSTRPVSKMHDRHASSRWEAGHQSVPIWPWAMADAMADGAMADGAIPLPLDPGRDGAGVYDGTIDIGTAVWDLGRELEAGVSSESETRRG